MKKFALAMVAFAAIAWAVPALTAPSRTIPQRVRALEIKMASTRSSLATTRASLAGTQASLSSTRSALSSTQSTLQSTQGSLANTQQLLVALSNVVAADKACRTFVLGVGRFTDGTSTFLDQMAPPPTWYLAGVNANCVTAGPAGSTRYTPNG
jgi:hypothetical protein